jgi:hypothetical protein
MLIPVLTTGETVEVRRRRIRAKRVALRNAAKPVGPAGWPLFLRFNVVGHKATIQADRRDAEMMSRYAKARAREMLKGES